MIQIMLQIYVFDISLWFIKGVIVMVPKELSTTAVAFGSSTIKLFCFIVINRS